MSYSPDQLLKIADNYANLAVSSLTALAKAKDKKKLDPKAKVRNRGTVCVPAANAKDKKDHFPINDADQARNALARVHQYSSKPEWWSGSLSGLQALVSRKVKAKYPKIDVGGKKEKKSFETYDKLLMKYAQSPSSQFWNPSTHQWGPLDLGAIMQLQHGAVEKRQENGQWAYYVKDVDGKWKNIPADRLGYYIDEQIPTQAPAQTTSEQKVVQQPSQSRYSNPQIKKVQMVLNKAHLTGADGKPLVEDGILGKNTQFAIESYKIEYGMPQATQPMAIERILQGNTTSTYAGTVGEPAAPSNQVAQQGGIVREYPEG